MSLIKFGLVGAGTIGKRHIMTIDKIEQAELVAIADPAPFAEAIAQDRQIPIYKDQQTMLAQGGIDAVIIATPTERHHQDTMTALSFSLPILIEKPIASTMAEADDITRYAQEKNCPVMVAHQRRYYPCVHKAKQLINDNSIGRLIAVTGQWTTRKDDEYYAAEWRRQQKAGPILTNLIHEIDVLRFICGEIQSLTAQITHHDQGFEKEDAAAICMKFENQAVATFLLSDRTPSPWAWEFALGENLAFPKIGQNTTRFLGTKGALEFPNLILWRHEDSNANWNNEIKDVAINAPFIDAYEAQCVHFCDVVTGKAMPIIDAKDASLSLKATLNVLSAMSEPAPNRR